MTTPVAATRRTILQAGLALLAGARLARGAPTETAEAPEALARDAYQRLGNPLNRFVAQSVLSTPSTPGGAPGTDTIYGYTWLDLRAGPQLLHVPDAHDRYYSIQLIDMYSDVFAYVGRRATGTKAGVFAIAGPGWTGSLPAGVALIRAPTADVITFTRTFVRDDADLPAARDLQSRFAFGDLADFPGAPRTTIAEEAVPLPPVLDLSGAGASFYDELCTPLAADPPRPEDRDALMRFAPIGIGPGRRPSTDAALKPVLEAAAPIADKLIKTAQYGTVVNGWYVNFSITGFPKDPLLRASSVKYGPGGHIAEEALYFNLDRGPDGQPLDGTKRYTLRFPAGGTPPVDAFWSLTAYTPAMGLVDNPIGRYAIKDRTQGLVHGADGSLEIQIQHAQPDRSSANWLPVPAGQFRLVLRTYQPRPEILSRSYTMPPVVIVS